MGKKKESPGLGKAIIRDRFKGQTRTKKEDSFLHTTELDDGYDWGRLNLQSVTEQSNLDDFLATAELAGTEFTAEKLNVGFVNPDHHSGLLTAEEASNVKDVQDKHRTLLNIPRRPAWDESTTREQLDQLERHSFLEWRRKLAELQEIEHLVLTPFEKNLEFWRQLWRVIERSDVVVQIVDARNPLLFRCEDLEIYVKEVGADKVNVVLVNKADLLSQAQREVWAEYFDREGIQVAFWSAVKETERIKELAAEEAQMENSTNLGDDISDSENEDYMEEENGDDASETQHQSPDTNRTPTDERTHLDSNDRTLPSGSHSHSVDNRENIDIESDISESTQGAVGGNHQRMECSDTATNKQLQSCPEKFENERTEKSSIKNCPNLLTGDELIDLLQSFHSGPKVEEGVTTLGLVGYPNVGKSSSINAILQTKKVPVSATPGRTKHFQTLYVDPTVMLCDCPGLVMPSFVSTKAELVISGILPIDQMRDPLPPVAYVCHRIPRIVLESTYGIMLPKPQEGEDPSRPPTAHEVLSAYAYMRGYMNQKGIPDESRAARLILKDFVNGKLLFCHPPPGVDIEDFKSVGEPIKPHKPTLPQGHAGQGAVRKGQQNKSGDVDRQFFSKSGPRMGSKGVGGVMGFTRKSGYTQHLATVTGSEAGSTYSSQQSLAEKPWKKHKNKSKEKLRRLHSDLDA